MPTVSTVLSGRPTNEPNVTAYDPPLPVFRLGPAGLEATGSTEAQIARRFAEFGFCFVALPTSASNPLVHAQSYASNLLDALPERKGKQEFASAAHGGAWGWRSQRDDATETLVLRDVPTVQTNAAMVRAVDNCVAPFRVVADSIAASLLRGLGVNEQDFFGVDESVRGRQTSALGPGDEQAAAYFEAVRFGGYHAGQPACADMALTAAMPCAPRRHAGAFAISIPSFSGSKFGKLPSEGLQIELPRASRGAADQWLDAEAVMVEQRAVLVVAGHVLGHISRGQVRLPQHRVVRPHGAAPRFSCSYHVLPHPAKPVPMVPAPVAARVDPSAAPMAAKSAGAPPPAAAAMTGRDVFLLHDSSSTQ
jgi:hypothetical protein